MIQQVHLGVRSVYSLEQILKQIGAREIFLVTGRASFRESKAEMALEKILKGYSVLRFADFCPNPQWADVLKGLEIFGSRKFDTVIAVGGGSVLDVAKLIRVLAAQNSKPPKSPGQTKIEKSGVPLIAIPTTAGSGSEATHFAVVYVDKIKHSVGHDCVLPDFALVDPELTYSLSPHLTAVTGIDALSQAIESYWSIHSTEESKHYSEEALELILGHLYKAVHKRSPIARNAMSKGAYLAGKAINITKTTAPHALSYALTSYFGVPHGHAVGLTLGAFFIYNSQVSQEDSSDSRGSEYVKKTIQDLNRMMGTSSAVGSCQKVSTLMESIGLRTRLGNLGLRSKEDRALIAQSVNHERLSNNPRRVTSKFLGELMEQLA